jgi:hypothetical protein
MRNLARLTMLALLALAVAARADVPLADVHVHYKWNQAELTSPQEALRILRDNHIALAVVIGTPPELALQLKQRRTPDVIALWSPYRQPGDWSRWAFDPTVLTRAREALASGSYAGIGELHLVGGFMPDWRSSVISGLAELAIEHRVPLMLHTEISRARYLLEFCQAFPQLRILWAHAGAILEPARVGEVLAACPGVSAELSARDPWRFVANPIGDANGALLPDWRALIERFPDRFMIGSDPVWPVEQLDGWDQADSGWQEYARFIAFHRGWLRQLDARTARRVGLGNAAQFFGVAVPQGD